LVSTAFLQVLNGESVNSLIFLLIFFKGTIAMRKYCARDRGFTLVELYVPKKFFNPETSGITTVLANTEGENAFDIVLK